MQSIDGQIWLASAPARANESSGFEGLRWLIWGVLTPMGYFRFVHLALWLVSLQCTRRKCFFSDFLFQFTYNLTVGVPYSNVQSIVIAVARRLVSWTIVGLSCLNRKEVLNIELKFGVDPNQLIFKVQLHPIWCRHTLSPFSSKFLPDRLNKKRKLSQKTDEKIFWR